MLEIKPEDRFNIIEVENELKRIDLRSKEIFEGNLN
jgi:hypothetical protein